MAEWLEHCTSIAKVMGLIRIEAQISSYSTLATAWPFHSQEWSISNFSCSLTRNTTSHGVEKVAFHSLLSQMEDVYTNSHYLTYINRLGECTLLNWEWKVILLPQGEP